MFEQQTMEVKILLFASGFVILALEILGIRILAPYVGSTVPVWAAVVGIPLLGSALGYYGGGILADRMQKKEIPLGLTLIAGAYICSIPVLREVVGAIAPHVSYGIGAICGALLLLLVPVLSLSALTVYVIRMFVKNIESVGQVHGDLYALVTIGSVVGVFTTSYALIPTLAVPHILFLFGGGLFVCGLHLYLTSSSEEVRRSVS